MTTPLKTRIVAEATEKDEAVERATAEGVHCPSARYAIRHGLVEP
jgi:hypothetical protein